MTQESTNDEYVLDGKLFDLESEVDERSKKVSEITLFEIKKGVESEINKRGNKHQFDRELRWAIVDSISDNMKEKKEFNEKEISKYHILLNYDLLIKFDGMELGHVQRVYGSWEFKKVVERTFLAMKSKLVGEVWRFIIEPLRILLEFNDANVNENNELGVHGKGLEIIINEFMIFHKLLYKIRVFREYFWLMLKEFSEEKIAEYRNEIENIDIRYYFYKTIANSCTNDMRCNIKRMDYFINEMKRMIITKLSPDGHYALRKVETCIFDKENIVRIIHEERKLCTDLYEKFTGQSKEIISVTSVNNTPNNVNVEIFTKPVFGQVQTSNVPLYGEQKQQEVLMSTQKTGNPVIHQTIKNDVKQTGNGINKQNNEITFGGNSVEKSSFSNSTFGSNNTFNSNNAFGNNSTVNNVNKSGTNNGMSVQTNGTMSLMSNTKFGTNTNPFGNNNSNNNPFNSNSTPFGTTSNTTNTNPFSSNNVNNTNNGTSNNNPFGGMKNSTFIGFSGFSCSTTQSGSTNFFSENKSVNGTSFNSGVTVNENQNATMTNNSENVQTQRMTNTTQQGNVQGIGTSLFGSTTQPNQNNVMNNSLNNSMSNSSNSNVTGTTVFNLPCGQGQNGFTSVAGNGSNWKEGHQSSFMDSSSSNQSSGNPITGRTGSVAKNKTTILSAFSTLKKN